MRHAIALVALILSPCAAVAQTPAAPGTSAPATQAAPGERRFELVVVPGHPGSPFLLDTTTGCIWHIIRNEETKRSTFIEVDVENLHWSWGSGAQQTLASRIDGSNLTDEQKRILKNDLARTGCGLSNVVLTPSPAAARPAAPATGETPATGTPPATPPASGQPRPRPQPSR